MHFLVNPAAAGGRLRRQWPATLRRLQDLGVDAPFTWTEAPGHAAKQAAALAEDGTDVVVAVGGDGTVDEVAQGLHRSGRAALGILPLGTGNDAARMLGIPGRLEGAAAVLLAGERRRIDLITAGDRVVVNAVGIGLLGDINANAASIKWIRGMGAYLLAAVATLLRYRCPTISLSPRDVPYQGPMTILAIQNGATTGGGFALCPAASPSDGVFDVTLVTETGVWTRFAALTACLGGTLGRRPFTVEAQATQLDLCCQERLTCHWDGNVSRIDPPGLRFGILPAALEVVAPAVRTPVQR